MCGVVGTFDLSGEPASATVIKRMTDVIAHRGPDGEGAWVDGAVDPSPLPVRAPMRHDVGHALYDGCGGGFAGEIKGADDAAHDGSGRLTSCGRDLTGDYSDAGLFQV